MNKTPSVSRRNFLGALGVTVGGTGLAGAGLVAGPQLVRAVEPAKGRIPDTPFKVGHMTFLTSAAAVLGEPSLKGHTMAAEEISRSGCADMILVMWAVKSVVPSFGQLSETVSIPGSSRSSARVKCSDALRP